MKAINFGFEYDLDLLIEEGIEMQEINVSILQHNNRLIISNPGQILSENEFYSYEDKYGKNSTAIKEKANLSKELEYELNSLSKTIFNGLNAQGLMRIDYFIDQNGRILLNEVNTLPSLGGNSVYPFLLNEINISNEEIVEYLIETALFFKNERDQLALDYI